jgi:hypothetical protein
MYFPNQESFLTPDFDMNFTCKYLLVKLVVKFPQLTRGAAWHPKILVPIRI